jgi:hypothetical protein
MAGHPAHLPQFNPRQRLMNSLKSSFVFQQILSLRRNFIQNAGLLLADLAKHWRTTEIKICDCAGPVYGLPK